MALTGPTTLSVDGGNATPSTTDAVTAFDPPDSCVVVLCCGGYVVGSVTPNVTISGGDLTWVRQIHRIYDDAVRTSAETIFTALVTSVGSQSITINWGFTPARKSWHLHYWTGHNATTPGGATGGADSAATTLSITLGASPASDSAVIGWGYSRGDTAITEGSGFTEIVEVSSTGTNVHRGQCQYDATSPGTTCDWSGMLTTMNSGVAFELKAASAGTTITPAVVAAVATVGTVTRTASALVAPAVVAATATVGTVTRTATALVAPATVAAVASVGTVTRTASALVAPAVVAAVATVGLPTVITGVGISPATVAAVATIGTVTRTATATVSPTTVAGVATVGLPTVIAVTGISPSTVAGVASVGTVTRTATALVSPATVAAVATVGQPSITPAVSPYEILVIPETNYSITGAKFVATTGSNGAAGTEAAPWQTLDYAESQCNSSTSTTIVARAGTYREAIGGSGNKWIIQNYPGEQVWISGSDVVTGWTADGARWRKDSWTYEPVSTVDTGLVDAAYPTSADALWIFINGDPLLQVATLAECGVGEFFHDKAADKLYIGSDPTSKTVEVTARSKFVELFMAGNTIRGVGVKHFATHQAVGDEDGAIRYNVNGGFTLENCVLAWNSARALTSYGDGITITDCTFIYNGWNGFTINSCGGSGATLERIRCDFNNFKHFSIGDFATAASAGCKITSTNPLYVRDSTFNDNIGMGLWCDLSVKDAEIVRNEFHRNEDHGLFYEVSAFGIIAQNYAVGNTRVGLMIGGANEIDIWNNTVHDNGYAIYVYEDDRTSAVDPDITYDTALVRIKNNIFSEGTVGDYVLGTGDNNVPDLVDAEDMISALDYNAYYRTSTGTPATLIQWSNDDAADSDYTTLAAFVAGEVYEDNGVEASGGGSHPWFVDPATYDFRLKSSATTLISRGVALPANVATALGFATGAITNRGADQAVPIALTAVAGTATVGTVTRTATALIAPATVAAVTTVGTVTRTASALIAPATVAAVAAVGTVSRTSSALVAPTVVAAVASMGAPTITATALIAPGTVAAVSTVGVVTVQTTTSTTITPTVVSAVATVGAPTVTATALVTPATVAAVASVGAPIATAGATVSITSVSAVATVGAPTITATALVQPATVAGVASVGAPVATTGALVTPATVAAVALVGSPTVTASALVTLTTVTATATVGAPTVLQPTTITPATVLAVASIGAPTIRATALVLASTVAAVATIGLPTILGIIAFLRVEVTVGALGVYAGSSSSNGASSDESARGLVSATAGVVGVASRS